MKKLHVVLINSNAPVSFRFFDRLIYTCLLRRKGQRGTVAKLSGYAGISRKTVATARDNLIGLGLAKVVKGKVVALPPTDDTRSWFYHLKNKQHWSASFGYYKFPVPSLICPLDHRGCAVLGYLDFRSRSKTKASSVTYSYIGLNIGIDYRTAKLVLLKLAEHGFVGHEPKTNRDRFVVPILDLDAVPGWFLDQHVDKSESSDIAQNANSVRIEPTDTNIDARDQEMTNDAEHTGGSKDEVGGRVVDDPDRPGTRDHTVRGIRSGLDDLKVGEENIAYILHHRGTDHFPPDRELLRMIGNAGDGNEFLNSLIDYSRKSHVLSELAQARR